MHQSAAPAVAWAHQHKTGWLGNLEKNAINYKTTRQFSIYSNS